MIKLILSALMLVPVLHMQQAQALGNHPQANLCPDEKPYYSFCSHSLHSLEGWYGKCEQTEVEAKADAVEHAKNYHNGNERWTGVFKISNAYGNVNVID